MPGGKYSLGGALVNSAIMNKIYLVTGGCGFIGSNIVAGLLLDDPHCRIRVIDNLSSTTVGDSGNSDDGGKNGFKFISDPRVEYHHLDICDVENTQELYRDVSGVFHCAAVSRIQLAIDDPLESVRVNALGTATVAELSKKRGVGGIVYSSTSSIYGNSWSAETHDRGMDENTAVDCLNPYSASKLAGEEYLRMMSRDSLDSLGRLLGGLRVAVLRYFNVYGVGEPVSGPWAPVIGLFLRQRANAEHLTIVGDGLQTRDFTWVGDVVRANLLAMRWLNSGLNSNNFGLFNIGSGVSLSINSIAAMVGGPRVYIDSRAGEARHTLADCRLAKSVLGWQPTGNVGEYINDFRK